MPNSRVRCAGNSKLASLASSTRSALLAQRTREFGNFRRYDGWGRPTDSKCVGTQNTEAASSASALREIDAFVPSNDGVSRKSARGMPAVWQRWGSSSSWSPSGPSLRRPLRSPSFFASTQVLRVKKMPKDFTDP